MDQRAGLYYFRARGYDPELGRFYSLDPAGQGTNPYAYAGDNPITNVDPLGLMAIPPGGSSFFRGPDWKKRFLMKCLSDVPGARHSLGWLPGQAITGADYLWNAMYVASMYDVSLQEAEIALDLMESGLLTMQETLSNAEYIIQYGGSLWETMASALSWVAQVTGKALSWAWNHPDVALSALNRVVVAVRGCFWEPHHPDPRLIIYLGSGLDKVTGGRISLGFSNLEYSIDSHKSAKLAFSAVAIDDILQHSFNAYSPIHVFAVRTGFYWGGRAFSSGGTGDIIFRLPVIRWRF